MVYNSFNSDAERRHKNFEAFLVCCDPIIPPPGQDEYPNLKIRPVLKWINYQCPMAWDLGKTIAVDEMIMGFKSMHQDKLLESLLTRVEEMAYMHTHFVMMMGIVIKFTYRIILHLRSI